MPRRRLEEGREAREHRGQRHGAGVAGRWPAPHGGPPGSRRAPRALAVSGLPASRLCLEVTETTLAEDLDASMARLEELERMGVRIAIDGVGAGGQGDAVIGGIVLLARTLGLETVAEGVARAEPLPRLRELGCDMTLGYHQARPMPAVAFVALLAGSEVVARVEGDAERRRER